MNEPLPPAGLQSDSALPELPESYATLHHDDGYFTMRREHASRIRPFKTAAYTADQMRAYARAALAASPAAPEARFDIIEHLHRQASFSAATFGPGPRVEGVTDHIAKELAEVRESNGALAEWVDVIILAFDGAWRSGATPTQIIEAMVAKQTKNEGRKWPDWRTAPAGKAIEHDRTQDGAPAGSGEAEPQAAGALESMSPAQQFMSGWTAPQAAAAGDAPHTFGSVMATALETIATMPLAEQDNMLATNMRHVARLALACRPAAPVAVAEPQAAPAPKWWHCPTHGPATANAWGCPDCVREMRNELAALKAAAPIAAPCPGSNPLCPCQDGSACHYRDAADGTKGWPVAVAEPDLTLLHANGSNAWADVPDAGAWVDELRGNVAVAVAEPTSMRRLRALAQTLEDLRDNPSDLPDMPAGYWAGKAMAYDVALGEVRHIIDSAVDDSAAPAAPVPPVAAHWSDCSTNNAPAYPAGPCDCVPTPAMCRAAVEYANGPDVYSRVPAEALAIEESIYAEVWRAMRGAAPVPQAERAGWVLVPVESTPDIRYALDADRPAEVRWARALAAAPEPTTGGVEGEQHG